MDAKAIVRAFEVTKEFDYILEKYLNLNENEVLEINKYLTDREYGNNRVIEKQSGSDKLGTVGTLGVTIAGGAAGATGVMVSGIGGTLLGSSALASMLGGIFVVSTPIGWIFGGGGLVAATVYGLSRLIESGGRENQKRENNIAFAKNGEQYCSVRKINRLLFEERKEIVDILLSYSRIKQINNGGGKCITIDIEDMFDETTKEKINLAHKSVKRELNQEISNYLEIHKGDIEKFEQFMQKYASYGFLDPVKIDDIMREVRSGNMLFSNIKDFESSLRDESLLNMQVLVYKLAIVSDGKISKQEMDWYFANMRAKGIDKGSARQLFENCPTKDVNIREIFLFIEDFFGSHFKTLLVDAISEIISLGGVDKKEYFFLRELCKQLDISENYILSQYEKNHEAKKK